MNESFRKIKQSKWRGAFVKSAVCGLSLALLTVGALLLGFKLAEVPFSYLWYILIGIGTALIGFGGALLLFRPTDKKLARELDEEYALSERTQTALAFRKEESAMVLRQREDAEEKLQSLPRKKFRLSKLWQYFALSAAAIALFVTAAALPLGAAAEPEDPPYTATPYEITVIKELIRNVKSSELKTDAKQKATASLEGLIETLSASITESRKEEAVLAAAEEIAAGITGGNSYPAVAAALRAAGSETLADLITRGGSTYRFYLFSTYEEVKGFYLLRADYITSNIEEQTAEYRNVFSEDVGLSERVAFAAGGIVGALQTAQIPPEDGLFIALTDFAERLFTFSEKWESAPAAAAEEDAGEEEGGEEEAPKSEMQQDMDALFEQSSASLTEALALQSYAHAMNRYVCNRLKATFGLETESADPPDRESGNLPGDTDREDNPHNGGYGTGTTLYPSDDEVYDPRTGKYVKYSEVLGEYYAEVQKLLRGETLTPEQQEMVRDYFGMLYNGFQTEEGEE